MISHNKELVSTIKMRVHLYSYLYWGTRSGSCRVFCLPIFTRSVLRVIGLYISHWKGIFTSSTKHLRSWELVQYLWRYSHISAEIWVWKDIQGGMLQNTPYGFL